MGLNVLSLFDGISCGQIALERNKIKVDNYYSSEIDNHSIKITQKNYPNTVQLGDIRKIKNDDIPDVDLIIAGSPCQSFSKAISNNKGFDGKSGLFFEFSRILNYYKPKYFLLENVMMKDEYIDIISEHTNVEPIYINSSLFSAQSRERLYWTNIDIDKLPLIGNQQVLKDILLDVVDDKYFYNESYDFHGDDKVVCATLNIKGHDILKRVNSKFHKCQTLTAVCGGNQHKKVIDGNRVRKLTPIEYERLMGIKDNYTLGVSDSQRYKMIGNGWEVNTISHIFKNIK